MPFTVGLTGGIASGKSLVATEFERLGVPVIDADVVSREVVEPGSPVLARIVERFGADMLLADGHLDRRRLRQLIFADVRARRDLEAITHPAIRARLASWRDARREPYCLLSAAILVESGMDAMVQRILVVDAEEAQQIERLVRRDGVAADLAQRMLAAQASRAQRLSRADDVILNSGEPAEVARRIAELHRCYLDLAADPAARSVYPSLGPG